MKLITSGESYSVNLASPVRQSVIISSSSAFMYVMKIFAQDCIRSSSFSGCLTTTEKNHIALRRKPSWILSVWRRPAIFSKKEWESIVSRSFEVFAMRLPRSQTVASEIICEV